MKKEVIDVRTEIRVRYTCRETVAALRKSGYRDARVVRVVITRRRMVKV